MEKQPIKISRLIFEASPLSGAQVKAVIDQKVPCVEFTLKGNHPQPVLKKSSEPIMKNLSDPVPVGWEPFIQFSPAHWDEMISEIFQQMVDAWNEKHSQS